MVRCTEYAMLAFSKPFTMIEEIDSILLMCRKFIFYVNVFDKSTLDILNKARNLHLISWIRKFYNLKIEFSSDVRGFLEIYPKTKTDNSVKCKNSFVTWYILSSLILLFYSCFFRFFLLKNPWNKLAFCTWIP